MRGRSRLGLSESGLTLDLTFFNAGSNADGVRLVPGSSFKEAYFAINDLRVYNPPGMGMLRNGTSTFGEPVDGSAGGQGGGGGGGVMSWIGSGRKSRLIGGEGWVWRVVVVVVVVGVVVVVVV